MVLKKFCRPAADATSSGRTVLSETEVNGMMKNDMPKPCRICGMASVQKSAVVVQPVGTNVISPSQATAQDTMIRGSAQASIRAEICEVVIAAIAVKAVISPALV